MNLCSVRSLLGLLLFLPLMLLTRPANAQITIAEAKEVAAFPLTEERMHAKYRVAVALAATFAAAKPESMNRAADPSLDEQIRALQRTTNVESVCRANGLTVREYALTTLAINSAMMPTNDPKYREYVARKPDDPMDVAASPEHVKFVQQHLSEIRAGTQEISVAYKAAKSRSN